MNRSTHARSTRALWHAISVSLAAVSLGAATTSWGAVTYRLEAEQACPAAGAAKPTWTLREAPAASAGKLLHLTNADVVVETPGIAMPLARAGEYRIWVRYLKAGEPACTFLTIVRDEDGEALAAHYCDLVSARPGTHPYQGPAKSAHAQGPVWEGFSLVAERPLAARISFMGKIHGGGHGERQIDCVIVTADRGFDPTALSGEEAGRIPPPAAAPVAPERAPAGFVSSPPLPPTTGLFSGVPEVGDQFMMGLIHCGGVLADPAQAVRLGFNRDHSYAIPGLAKHGLKCIGAVDSYGDVTPEFAQAHPAPEGRAVNAEGQAGAQWSLSYPPLAAETPRVLRERVARALPYSDVIAGWRICPETAGFLDYSTYSIEAFRKWLAGKHGTIATLNERWGSAYQAFDAITPPAKFSDNRPCWFEFRDFCGREFTAAVSRQIAVLDAVDPERRDRLTQNSNLHLLAPYFTSLAPLDFEQFWTEGLKNERYACWDGYAADDFVGCEIELVRSLSGGKRPLNQEWSVHAMDPRIAARTFWNYVAKGCAGVHVFEFFGDYAYCDEWDKWAVARGDLTPRDRLGAYSDAAQEAHRLEPLLTRARLTHAVKPVALYYSRLDLSVAEPFLSLWGHGVDSPAHLYEVLRGQGYAVRWVTPKQIEAGELDRVGALVMADCRYVPTAAAQRIEEWVRAGGAVIGDRWPGAWNEYAQPQTTLAKVFGVAAAPKSGGGKLAVQQSVQGYGEVTVAALDPKSLAESVGEIFQQWDATHPVAQAMGDYFLSGMGLERIVCTAGDVIGASYYGTPGVVVNGYGKGKALYLAMMLATIYESSATPYEWDSAHSGTSFGRLLHAFLDDAGVRPAGDARIDNPRVRAKLHVEAPLVTPEGNTLIGLVSYNDGPVGPFPLEVELPEAARGFRTVMVVVGGSRQLIPVAASLAGTRLRLTMPAFDTHAMIVAVKSARPLVGLEVAGAPRAAAGLVRVAPGADLTVTATVHNPSDVVLPRQKLELILPRGWVQSAAAVTLASVPAWGSRTATFRVRPPRLNSALRLRPILVRYAGIPTTEMVWWGKPGPHL